MTQTLKSRMASGDFIVAPGVFDMISALVADRMGFDALYMTGYGTVASHLGLPDAGLATYSDMLGRAQQIAQMTTTPLIADADTGYGGLLNVRHTVRGYEAAGVAAIQIEDQKFPKKCGHTPNREVIPIEDMVRKIMVASDSRSNADFLIIARTDSRTALGLDEAIRRGIAYHKAGADIIFVEAPESKDEMQTICDSIDAPLLANMVDGGSTPVLSADVLKDMGFALSIFPGSGFLAAGKALETVYSDIRENGRTTGRSELYDFDAFNTLMGFEDVWDFDRCWSDK